MTRRSCDGPRQRGVEKSHEEARCNDCRKKKKEEATVSPMMEEGDGFGEAKQEGEERKDQERTSSRRRRAASNSHLRYSCVRGRGKYNSSCPAGRHGLVPSWLPLGPLAPCPLIHTVVLQSPGVLGAPFLDRLGSSKNGSACSPMLVFKGPEPRLAYWMPHPQALPVSFLVL